MKRLALVLSIVLVLAAGGVATLNFWPDQASAQDDERVIPVVVSSYTDYDGAEDGEPCSFMLDVLTFINTYQQIVISDETGDIVAIENLDDGTYEASSSGTGHFCKLRIEIPVPDAELYTVRLGDLRIVGFTADQFPISVLDEVWISL